MGAGGKFPHIINFVHRTIKANYFRLKSSDILWLSLIQHLRLAASLLPRLMLSAANQARQQSRKAPTPLPRRYGDASAANVRQNVDHRAFGSGRR